MTLREFLKVYKNRQLQESVYLLKMKTETGMRIVLTEC